MRIVAGLAGLLALPGCIAQVGEDGGLRTTALISPVGIVVVPVHVPQSAPAPTGQPRPLASIRP